MSALRKVEPTLKPVGELEVGEFVRIGHEPPKRIVWITPRVSMRWVWVLEDSGRVTKRVLGARRMVEGWSMAEGDWIEVRPDDRGGFDELVAKDVQTVHMEMIDDDFLWIGLTSDAGDVQVVRIRVEGRKLQVTTEKG